MTKQSRTFLGGWVLIVLFLQAACAPVGVRGSPSGDAPSPSPPSHPGPGPGVEPVRVSSLGFLELGPAPTRPVPVGGVEFKKALSRLLHGPRLKKSPPEAARELLAMAQSPRDVEQVSMSGLWELEMYRDRTYTFVPLSQTGPVPLTPEAEEALRREYLSWCEGRGGGDCLSLLEDGPTLRTDDRRTLALALALGSVLDETREALAHEVLNPQAVVSLLVWTVALYGALWLVPEPTAKALAATLTVVLVAWLGLDTLWGLMDGWAQMATQAHDATTFAELRDAGAQYAKVLGKDAARTMILAVAALTGRTLREVAERVKSLPGFGSAQAQWEAQGGAALLAPEVAEEMALAQEGALAQALVAVETVAASPQGPLAVVMLKPGAGGGAGGSASTMVLRHRGGNQQVLLSNGQRWHLPRGKSLRDIPAQDKVGDQLQEAVTKAAQEWGPHRLTSNEQRAINAASEKGKYWLARLLEREARGRYVHEAVRRQFQHILRFNPQGVDVVDPVTNCQYEILSGTESNLARHGRRMAGEFFRMLPF